MFAKPGFCVVSIDGKWPTNKDMIVFLYEFENALNPGGTKFAHYVGALAGMSMQPMNVIFESEITCSFCGHVAKESMPDNVCQFYYACLGCHALLRAKKGDYCVFCSFGTVKCPPIQRGGKSCCEVECDL